MIQDKPDEYESMQNAYFYFMQTVSCLTKSAKEQCEMMGWFNVAYELQLDAKVVDNLIGQQQIIFTAEEVEQMKLFSNSLQGLAPPFLGTGGSRNENLENMQASQWDKVREEAKKLELILTNQTAATLRYFNEL